MNRLTSITSLAALLFIASTAAANIDVVFTESAPKDRFTITNSSTCVYEGLLVEIDLSNTVGKLIFDTTSAGAGVEVYQIFEVLQGDITLVSDLSVVRDGDTTLTVQVDHLLPSETVSFTIDVDDTLPAGELGSIRISDNEITGGQVTIQMKDGQKTSAIFDQANLLSVALPNCNNTD